MQLAFPPAQETRALNARLIQRVLLPLLFWTLFIGSVQAGILGSSTLVKQPPGTAFASPDAALGAPWLGYSLGIQTTLGEMIGGVDVTIRGQFHQRWIPGEDDNGVSFNIPTPNSANATNGDSHLRPAAGSLFGVAPMEDNTGTGSPLVSNAAAYYGVGNILSGQWSLPTPSTNISVAYIVVPKNSLPTLDIRIRVTDPEGKAIGIAKGCEFTLAFCGPEISVSSNNIQIADGDGTPSVADNTDFGSTTVGTLQQRTFTIYNDSSTNLELGLPTFTGPFSLIGNFPSLVGGAQSASFTVGLDTSVTGSFAGSVSFGTNVFLVNDPFNFSLAARVVPEPTSCWVAFTGLMISAIAGGRLRDRAQGT